MKGRLPRISTTSGAPSKPVHSLAALDKALLDAYDLMQRSILQNDFVVVGDAGRCLKERRGLDCEGLDFVIPKKLLNTQVIDMIKEWADPNMNEQGFSYQVGGVPLRFKFVGEYDYFKFADVRPYGPEQYRIPNQWDEYWQHREEIQ